MSTKETKRTPNRGKADNGTMMNIRNIGQEKKAVIPILLDIAGYVQIIAFISALAECLIIPNRKFVLF